MKSHISKVRIAALAVGLAIVMSSCGIQNQAGDSSGSGKTKNFALLADGQFCFDTEDEQFAALIANDDAHDNWHMNRTTEAEHMAIVDRMFFILDAQIGGCPAPAAASASEEIAAEAAVYTCVKPEKKQEMIDGYKEQIAKTDYPDSRGGGEPGGGAAAPW